MFSDLDAARLSVSDPVGLAPGSDPGLIVTGTVTGVNTTAAMVQVIVQGSTVWVPAIPGIYTAGGACRVLRSPLDGGRLSLVLCPLTVPDVVVTGTVTAINTAAGTVTVQTLGQLFDLPAVSGTYDVGSLVLVERSPVKFGAPVVVLGLQGSFDAPDPAPTPGGQDDAPQQVTRQSTILPQWSGSWRSAYSRWDSWNTNRYGGKTTLWQGNQYGSGDMTGLATYGSQVLNLRADQITRMQVRVWRADSSVSSGKVASIRASSNGSKPAGAPNVQGGTASSPSLAPGKGAWVDLPSSMFDAFRTGALRGLVTVGTAYAGFSGVPSGVSPTHADGFALLVTYKVTE